MIKKYIELHASEKARLQKLYNYYLGNQDIALKTVTDTSKPCNKVTENYCSYISDFYSGYFLGNGISYNAPDSTMLEEIKQIFRYNDEQEENISVEDDASIFGLGVELLYLDADKQIRFKKVDTREIILIYDNTLEEELLYCIRYYEAADIMQNTSALYVEVYTANEIIYYTDAGTLAETARTGHIFGLVPIVPYLNNAYRLGDFEGIISLQDALNKLESCSIDEVEYFADCYLYLVGMDGTSSEDIANMKTNRALLLPENGLAGFMTKQADDAYITNLKNRITEAIHKSSKCPALTDESFTTSSGIALKYKLLGLESNTSKKERYYKKGIQRRLELICNYLNVLGSNYDYRDIGISFSRALPTSETETADIVTKLNGIVSKETLLGLLPFIEDAKVEIDKISQDNSLDTGIDFTAGSDADAV